MSYKRKINQHTTITPEILYSVLPQYQPISKKKTDYEEARADSNLYKAITKDNKIGIFRNPAYKRMFCIEVPSPTKSDPFKRRIKKMISEDELSSYILQDDEMLFVAKSMPVKVFTLQEAMDDSGYEAPQKESDYIL